MVVRLHDAKDSPGHRRGRLVARVAAVAAAVAALVLGAAWILEWPLEKAVYLAPVILACVAAFVGIVLLWVRVAYLSLRESPRPRLVLALWLAGIGMIFLLTVLGVELPRE